jgi:large subunit ribosomal protein L18
MYAQLIDDVNGNTVAAASTKLLQADLNSTSDIDAAKAVGTAIAKAALEKGYETVVFDRGAMCITAECKRWLKRREKLD